MKSFFRNIKFQLLAYRGFRCNLVKIRNFSIDWFAATIPEKEIVIVVASFNNKNWYQKNLDSIFNQKYSNYKLIYIDDCSTDGTAELVEQYINQNNQVERSTLIKNCTNQGATANRYKGSLMADDNAIVLILDGDDWLAHDKVFRYINKIYTTTNCWLTYGQFVRYPSGEKGHCKKLDQTYNFRKMDKWYASHLRTYYAWLFKKIKLEDLKIGGNFFDVSGDVAEMLPLLEMARGHIRFIKRILYVYNQAHSLNDYKLYPKRQIEMFEHIKNQKAYMQLNKH